MKASLRKLIGLGVTLSAAGAFGVVISAGPVVIAAPAYDPTTAAGLWEQVDEKTGKPESWFRITERNGVYQGSIVKIFFKPG